MGRWSPTVVAEAPRNAGMGAATFGQAAMGMFSDLESIRDRRRQRELQEQENAQQQAYRDGVLANDASRLAIMRDESKSRQLTENAELDLKYAQAGAVSDPNQITGNAQPGSPVANSQAAKDESDTARTQREASELYPVNPVRFVDPRTGQPRYIDSNAKARSEFLAKRMESVAKEQEAKAAHQREIEKQLLRNKGQLDAARVRARNSGRGGGTGGGGGAGSDKVDGVTPTQMTAELKSAQTAMAGLARRRGSLAKKIDPDSDDYDDTVASQWQQDSTLTVDKFRPETNPRMAAAMQRYGAPDALRPFMNTSPDAALTPLPRKEVEEKMYRLSTVLRDSRDPRQRAEAQRRLMELAAMANKEKMR